MFSLDYFKLALLPLMVTAPVELQKESQKSYFGIKTIEIKPKTSYVNFRPLKEVGIKNISMSYFDFSGSIPDKKKINWSHALDRLWDKKLKIRGVSSATEKFAPEIKTRYDLSKREQITLKDHVKILDKHLIKIKQKMNWGGLCRKYDLRGPNCFNFVVASYNLDAKMLTAYSMTELGPYRKGIQNYTILDLYMRNAGRNYLDAVPALGDTYLSLGRYQFTSYAVGHDADGPRPANLVSKYSAYKIPSSVTKLKGIQHDRAAYYFSVHNLASLFRWMSTKDARVFQKKCLSKTGQITEYIATAHHNPYWAKKRALAWIQNGCSKPLKFYQGPRLEIYSIKTATNYEALKLKS